MKISVQARHMDVTSAIREFVEAKVAKLPRFLDTLQSIEVILGMEADQASVEIVAAAKKKSTFVATHRDADMYTAIDQCLHKIAEQLRRHKDRVRDRQGAPHSTSTPPAEAAAEEPAEPPSEL